MPTQTTLPNGLNRNQEIAAKLSALGSIASSLRRLFQKISTAIRELCVSIKRLWEARFARPATGGGYGPVTASYRLNIARGLLPRQGSRSRR